MTREEFRALLEEQILVCDGPLGAIFGEKTTLDSETLSPLAEADALAAQSIEGVESTDYEAIEDDDLDEMPVSDDLSSENGESLIDDGDEVDQSQTQKISIPEMLALDDKTRLVEIHTASLEAGAHIILTNTFAANGPTLEPLGLEPQLSAILGRSVEAAREAIESSKSDGQRPGLLGFLIGPLAPGISPNGSLGFAEALASYQEVVMTVAEMGIDLFVLDSFSDAQEMRAALIAIRELNLNIPVVVQMEFDRDGRTKTRTSPAVVSAVCRSLGADAIGACGNMQPDEMIPVAVAFEAVADLPLIFQPSAVTSGLQGERLVKPQEFAKKMESLIAKGAAIIGCWCARKPHYTAYLQRMSKGMSSSIPQRQQRLVLASSSRDVEIGSARGLVTVKSWDEAARLATRGTGDWQREALRKALAPARRAGTQMLEIRQSTPGLDEPEFFQRAMPLLQDVGDLPLLLTADTRKGLEQALQCAAGRPLIASVWLEKARLERILPLARKYGAGLVAVCMSGDKSPGGAEERLATIEDLIGEIVSAGLSQEDIIVDPIMAPMGETPVNTMEVLRTISLFKEKLGQPTLLKLARFAPDIEGRESLDASLVSMAMANGLDAAVGDFHLPALRQAAVASSVIMGRDPAQRRFDAYVRSEKNTRRDSSEQDRDSSDHRSREGSRGDRPQRSGGGYGDRRPREGGFGGRPQRSGGGGYGDRRPREGGFSDRPQRSGGGGYGDRRPREGGFSDRPQRSGGGGYGDRRPREGGFSGRPQRSGSGGYGDRPQRSGGGGYGDRRPREGGFGSRPQRSGGGGYGDRRPREGGYGDRPQRSGGGGYGDRRQREGGYSDRPQRSGGGGYGDRRPREGGYGDRPQRSGGGGYGDRRPREGGSGNRPQRSGGGGYGDRRPREGGFGSRPQRSGGGGYGDRRPREGGYGDRPQRSEGGGYGKRPQRSGGSGYGDRRPREDSPSKRPHRSSSDGARKSSKGDHFNKGKDRPPRKKPFGVKPKKKR